MNTGRFGCTDTNTFVDYTCQVIIGFLFSCGRLFRNWIPCWETDWICCVYNIMSWRHMFNFSSYFFLINYNTHRFRLWYNVTFAPITDEGLTGIVSNHVVLKVNPFRSGHSVFSQHIIDHIGQFLRIIFSEPVLIVLQSFHVYPWVLIPVTLILILQ